MTTYALTCLTLAPGAAPAAVARLPGGLAALAPRGELLACLGAEIGALNRLLLIHGHEDPAALAADQARIATERDPFGLGDLLTGITCDLFAPFPGTPAIAPRACGPVFEVRSYALRPGGLAPTIELWARALPERVKLSPLVGVMHALAGATPRFVHIWAYRDLAERAAVRARAIEAGVWPPPGGTAHIAAMQTEIFLPAPFSPLR